MSRGAVESCARADDTFDLRSGESL